MRSVIVIDGQKLFVEIEPRIGLAFADLVPIDSIEHASERIERGFQRLLILAVFGEQAEGRADEGTGFGEF